MASTYDVNWDGIMIDSEQHYHDYQEWQEYCRKQYAMDTLMLLQEASEPSDIFAALR